MADFETVLWFHGVVVVALLFSVDVSLSSSSSSSSCFVHVSLIITSTPM